MNELDKIVTLQKKIAPELIALLSERYFLLRHIFHHQPIGRRLLASQLAMSENSVRSGIRILRESGLIVLSGMGMSVTAEGETLVAALRSYMGLCCGLTQLATDLTKQLNIGQVYIIPGDCETEHSVLAEMGREAARLLISLLTEKTVIAVSGGSTMAEVANSVSADLPGVTVVPTRGGVGRKLEHQANNVAALMADKFGGNYRLLHTPEVMSDEALATFKAVDIGIDEVQSYIKEASVLLYGVGRADRMAARRSHPPEVMAKIAGRAVGEAVGNYLTLSGQCVYTYATTGFRLSDFAGVKHKIAVAGGAAKAAAIIAAMRAGDARDILVVDEAAARAIAKLLRRECKGETMTVSR